jgi:hypothetical protein
MHVAPTAAPAMTIMAVPVAVTPIYRRHIALIGAFDARRWRDRRSLRGPGNGCHQHCCSRHRKNSPCHSHSPCRFSFGANLSEHITHRRDGSSTTRPFAIMNGLSEIVFDSLRTLAIQRSQNLSEMRNCLKNLKQVALTGRSRAAARFGWSWRSIDLWSAFRTRRNASIGKFDFERHARADDRSAAQWLASGIAHQRKSARQYAAIGKRRKKFAAAFGTRRAHRDALSHRASRAIAEGQNPFALLSEARAMHRDIGGNAGA